MIIMEAYVAVPGVEAAGDLADEEGALHAHHEQERAATHTRQAERKASWREYIGVEQEEHPPLPDVWHLPCQTPTRRDNGAPVSGRGLLGDGPAVGPRTWRHVYVLIHLRRRDRRHQAHQRLGVPVPPAHAVQAAAHHLHGFQVSDTTLRVFILNKCRRQA